MSTTEHREHVELPITGMTCALCVNRIQRKLNKLDGVSATVNYASEKATVDYDPGVANPEDLVDAVEAAGYQAVMPAADSACDDGRNPVIAGAAMAFSGVVSNALRLRRFCSARTESSETRQASSRRPVGAPAGRIV